MGQNAKSPKINYGRMGGASPLTAETMAQAAALEARLAAHSSDTVKVFIAMRYWKPDSVEAATAVAAFAPDEVILLPLYPQYSTATTASSLAAWTKAYRGGGRVRSICCYPVQENFIEGPRPADRPGLGGGWSASRRAAAVFRPRLARNGGQARRSLSGADRGDGGGRGGAAGRGAGTGGSVTRARWGAWPGWVLRPWRPSRRRARRGWAWS